MGHGVRRSNEWRLSHADCSEATRGQLERRRGNGGRGELGESCAGQVAPEIAAAVSAVVTYGQVYPALDRYCDLTISTGGANTEHKA